ncbi:MAG: amino acid adenylation domain-containing protein [Legionellaceae bacterium]|nr:amino acid adenylation domain-containing protein [Legionellaceae bacterium]
MHKIEYKKNAGQYIGKGTDLSLNREDTIPNLFEKQVQRYPDSIAIQFNKSTLTFKELDQSVNRMANYLTHIGISIKSPIAIYLNPGVDMIIAILAIIKMGCYYVLLDINYPIKRILFMIQDSEANFIISTENLQHNLVQVNSKIINIESINNIIGEQSSEFNSKAQSHDLAYLMYTSGTTGVPKGVKITNYAVNNHMSWMQEQFHFNSTDKILLKTPLSFDPSVWELFIPLFCGAQLIIAPAGSHADPESLIDLVFIHKITIIQMVPSILKLFLDNKRVGLCKSLKKVFVGGESLRPEIKVSFFKRLKCRLINLYGPTEATIDITFHEIKSEQTDLHNNIIGKPIANTSIYLVNEQGNLTTIGEAGELLIGSLSLSTGYHNRESLTQEFFIANPFETEKYPTLYRTGDLARWLPNGDLEYLGRNNDQVKVNGVRIEPKEIALSIIAHDYISDCIVVKKVDSHGHDYLACYLISVAGKELNITEIKNHLKAHFPIFMIPKAYIQIEHIPLTVNGKVDNSALPEPNFNSTIKINIEEGELLQYEHDLLIIWQIVLEMNTITLEDDFFDAGGHSLLALKLLTLIHEKFGISMKFRDIFIYNTVKLQAEHIKTLQEHMNSTVIPEYTDQIPNPVICLQPHGSNTPLFLIHPIGGTVFWFPHLSKLLGISRPIYGIQDPSIELEKPVLNSIEELAAFYLFHIRKIQPQGPYLIGGASFGATVAAEIASQLRKNNEDTSSIIVFDGWAVYPNSLLDDNYFRNSMLRQHEELKTDFKKYGLPPPEILFDIQWFRLNLLWNYQLGLIEQPIALFKSQELMPVFSEIDSPFNHWENFTNKPISTFIVPGNHETMFQEPHVYKLATCLLEYFNKNKL